MACSEFIQNQITVVEAEILAYQTASSSLIANPTKSYSLDTGQTKQTVNRYNLKDLQDQVTLLLSRRDSLYARCNGGSFIGRPKW